MRKERIKSYLGIIFDLLVILDLILIFISLPIQGLHLIDYAGFVRAFDLTICFLLLIEFFYGLYKSDAKAKYFKEHFLDLIASIPFDIIVFALFGSSSIILNMARFLRLVRVVRVFRAVNIVKKYGLEKVIKRTHADKIFIVIAVIVVIFTILLTLSGHENLSDSFYFVVITLTTVGYGSEGFNEPLAKFVTIFLIIVGVLVFSTITGVTSSFFIDKMLEEGISVDENLHFINQKLNFHEREMEKTRKELGEIKEELEKSNKNSEELKQEISELKELIKENNK